MSIRPIAPSTLFAARRRDTGSPTCAHHSPDVAPDHRLIARHRHSWSRSRGLLPASAALLIGVIVLTGCTAQGTTTGRTSVPTVMAVPTCTPELGPCPVSGLLDLPPQHCPTSPLLDTLSLPHFGGFVGSVQLMGHAPVWVPHAYLGGGTSPITIHLEQSGYTPLPGTKIIWEVGPDYTQRCPCR